MKNLFLIKVVKNLFVLIIFGFLLNASAGEPNKSSITNALINKSEENFLLPEEAFNLNLIAVDNQNIQAIFTVAPGHYLYRERIKFEIKSPFNTKVALVTLPSGDIKTDPNFGDLEVYHHDFKANINFKEKVNSEITILASYQGCSEKGLCYAPIKKSISVKPNLNAPAIRINSAANTSINLGTSEDDTTNLLKSGNIWLIIVGFFGAGLLLSLTPCVLPMIPILSSIIVGTQHQGAEQNKLHSFGLSVAYVSGMALSYTLAGIAAGLSGNLISQSLQNPWVLSISAIVFILLAFSMFGFYELQLPSSLETKLINASNKFKGGQFLSVFVMGALSALIVSPCVAAPLAGALIYISQSKDVLLGGIALFALSLGMGMPLLFIGASAGKLLPKTGNWMNGVRTFFGVLMLGMAIWLISPIIPLNLQFLLWSGLLIVSSVYLNALDNLPQHANSFAKFWKGMAVILLLIGIALLVGALSGAKSLLHPLSGVAFSQNNTANNEAGLQTQTSLRFTHISSIAELEKKLSETNGQPIMLDFYADWCTACKELEQVTFSDNKVQQLLKNTTLLQLDVTKNSDEDKALLKRFALYGPPGIVFFNENGKEIKSAKTIGFQNADRFISTLSKRDSCIYIQQSKEVSTVQC